MPPFASHSLSSKRGFQVAEFLASNFIRLRKPQDTDGSDIDSSTTIATSSTSSSVCIKTCLVRAGNESVPERSAGWDEELEEMALGWEQGWDEQSQRMYYFNRNTWESSFTAPFKTSVSVIGFASRPTCSSITFNVPQIKYMVYGVASRGVSSVMERGRLLETVNGYIIIKLRIGRGYDRKVERERRARAYGVDTRFGMPCESLTHVKAA